MFIVLLNGIYCFLTRMTNVKTKVMALSAWPRTWLTPVRVHVPTKILKWILVRAVGGAIPVTRVSDMSGGRVDLIL